MRLSENHNEAVITNLEKSGSLLGAYPKREDAKKGSCMTLSVSWLGNPSSVLPDPNANEGLVFGREGVHDDSGSLRFSVSMNEN
jgi:hypothetical protein